MQQIIFIFIADREIMQDNSVKQITVCVHFIPTGELNHLIFHPHHVTLLQSVVLQIWEKYRANQVIYNTQIQNCVSKQNSHYLISH